MLAPELLLALHIWCGVYKVEPALPLAVMQNESGFKCGPLGKKGTFIGPAGIHRQFRKKWAIDDPKENIRVLVARFEGVKGKDAIVRRLKSYNKEWYKNNYLRDVLAAYKQYKEAYE